MAKYRNIDSFIPSQESLELYKRSSAEATVIRQIVKICGLPPAMAKRSISGGQVTLANFLAEVHFPIPLFVRNVKQVDRAIPFSTNPEQSSLYKTYIALRDEHEITGSMGLIFHWHRVVSVIMHDWSIGPRSGCWFHVDRQLYVCERFDSFLKSLATRESW